jgi:hypothetical protein
MRLNLPRGLVRAGLAPLVTALAATWRLERHHEDRMHQVYRLTRPRAVLLWHEALLPCLWAHRSRGIAVVVSAARDGRYLSDYAERLGYRPLGGSSTRGGAGALRGALRAWERGATVAFTPDGPVGPRRVLKAGPLAAAQRAGATVVAIHAEARPRCRLRSWDRFLVPAPFATVRIAYGEPFEIGAGDRGLEEAVRRVRTELDSLVSEIAWPGDAPTS